MTLEIFAYSFAIVVLIMFIVDVITGGGDR